MTLHRWVTHDRVPDYLLIGWLALPTLGGSNLKIERRTLSEFQRWVIRKAYTFIPFEFYDVNAKGRAVPEQGDLLTRSTVTSQEQKTP